MQLKISDKNSCIVNEIIQDNNNKLVINTVNKYLYNKYTNNSLIVRLFSNTDSKYNYMLIGNTNDTFRCRGQEKAWWRLYKNPTGLPEQDVICIRSYHNLGSAIRRMQYLENRCNIH